MIVTADILGLDIGGANLKAAHVRGQARTLPFALWKQPHGLTAALRDLIDELPPCDMLAVTMTGESCDCYATKREGVAAILASMDEAAGRTPVRVWTTHSQFLPLEAAGEEPLRVASANWLALAHLAGRHAGAEAALALDIGSTTTDIIELWKGKPVPNAWTDVERLRCGELVYTGVRRTPVSAVLGGMQGTRVAAELFATMLDAYLALDLIDEDDTNCDTADGRPATRPWAHARLARMLGGDAETVSASETNELARECQARQSEAIAGAIEQVCRQMPEPPSACVVSGSGEFLARRIATARALRVVSLSEQLGPGVSEAAAAYAVAVLAREWVMAGREQL